MILIQYCMWDFVICDIFQLRPFYKVLVTSHAPGYPGFIAYFKDRD